MENEQCTLAQTYTDNGYVFPLEILSANEVAILRNDYEKAETECAGDEAKLKLLKSYPEHVLPSFSKLIRNEKILDAVSIVLGSDLMVWSAGLFVKEAKSEKIVSWHQDLTYWGLNDVQELTCWVALSHASKESGCMKFVPGSHKSQLVAHVDKYSDDNLLSRGQEIVIDVDENDAVFAELKPGQASMHHGHLFHASGPNRSDDRRIGVAIRYIIPSMRQNSNVKTSVSLVKGQDSHGNFDLVKAPKERLSEENFIFCTQEQRRRASFLYQ